MRLYKMLHTAFAAGAQSCHPCSPQKREYSGHRVRPNDRIKSSCHSNTFSHWDYCKGNPLYINEFTKVVLFLSHLFYKEIKYFRVRLYDTNQALLLIPCKNQVMAKGFCLVLCSFPLPRSLLHSPNFAVLTLGNWLMWVKIISVIKVARSSLCIVLWK